VDRPFALGAAAALRRLPVVLLMAASMPASADVSVAIVPGSVAVEPGVEFEVRIEVTEAGSRFNAFDLIVGFDPAALTAVPMSPLSAQVGAALNSACPSVFNDFGSGNSGDTIGCALLCAGVSITGPGEIYRLRFRASQIPQTTTLAFAGPPSFYDAGIRVSPVRSEDAAVRIGTPPLDAGDRAAPERWSIRVAPNPARSGAVFLVGSPGTLEWTVAIVDLQGRELRRFPVVSRSGGTSQLEWDGTAGTGTTLAPGVYQIVVRNGEGASMARTRLIVLR
jgi:hypothetical protein